jgi:katanin p60 ATPase-containing subunit A1
MGQLKRSILRQQLQHEVDAAKALEKQGKYDKAMGHYMRAAAIYRRMASEIPPERAGPMFETASQYETVVQSIRKREDAGSARQIEPEILDQMIDSMIVTEKPDVEWEDIGGLKEAKNEIKEAIILPFIQSKPDFVSAPRTILLYGPPGTGKTLLAKASASNLEATFFEARASSLLSKYFGESTKLVNALFSKARKVQPSLIFMDELDSLAISRDTDISESTRRVLAQILTEIDGFRTATRDRILIMAATNKPWDLDDAIISRFQKKIYVPLPDAPAREKIFSVHLRGAELSGASVSGLAEKSEGFSGRDIASVSREAIISMVREQNPGIHDLSARELDKYVLKHRPLEARDFEDAFGRTKPSLQAVKAGRYEKWREEFGG